MEKSRLENNMEKGRIIWFTGLSGSGKTTLSKMLKQTLEDRGLRVFSLDGDRVRRGLNKDLGFSEEDRAESLKRSSEMAAMLADSGFIVIAAFITPLETLRRKIRYRFDPKDYVEVYLDCTVENCEQRDPKGLYKKARQGKIKEFTGISSPFDVPSQPDIKVPTFGCSPMESFRILIDQLEIRFPEICTKQGHCEVVAPEPSTTNKLLVIGLDCAAAKLFFRSHKNYLPFINNLSKHGVYGELRSTDPPITIPAWTTITTGLSPGQLGLYGFRNRVGHDYSHMKISSADDVDSPRVWDYLDKDFKRSVIVGLPQTYPPKPHSGVTIPGFPIGKTGLDATHPPGLAQEIPGLAEGEYMVDCPEFRTADKDRLLKDLYSMVNARFNLAGKLITRERWNLFMLVEIALDRLHHGFWRYCATDHPKFQPGNEYENVINEFYSYIDNKIAGLLSLVTDETTVMIVSDHGVKNMTGGVRINQWLMENGYLSLKKAPLQESALIPDMIDWSKTIAWGEGGYYSRIFLNVKGREPQGIIDPKDYESIRKEIAHKLNHMSLNGNEFNNSALYPEEIYPESKGFPPDLLVYFDNLHLRSIGEVGPGSILTDCNDTGPDDANHDHDGIFILTKLANLRSGKKIGKEISADCMDVTPTILDLFGLSKPMEMKGRSQAIHLNEYVHDPSSVNLSQLEPRPYKNNDTQGFSEQEEELVKKQLKDLGYI